MQARDVDTLIAALPDPVLLVGRDGRVQAANHAATELLGAQIRGAQIRAHLRQPEVAAMLDRALAGDAGTSAQFVTASTSAETVWQVTARPAGAGALVLSFRDVSDREAAEAQRREFVANVSHELRSPLTVLAGFIETLQGPAAQDAAARTEFLAIMAREAERMTGLVADLLSLSRVEGAAKIRPRTPVALDMVLRATLAALRPQIESAGLKVTLTLPDDLPEVPGDYDQLVQVYHNLVENAVKYGGPGGRIEIAASVLPALAGFDGPVLRVAVTDHGEGIDPIHIPRLTERFYRVDRARSRDQGGTGLGLAIVKHIVSRHRGRLCIRSAPGAGATFATLLPTG
jgi:two-component system, OmpR family, phosphate regulon sensor histidine kinase PhoR